VGGRGSRKLQDLFVDRKVPHALRAAWPILVAGERILWVPGLRAAEGAAATDKTPGTIWVALVRG
jgi:tRNA(Ile)-lysidine synthetase-like protein